ncbi:MAG: pilin [Gammaproteobacteria bacterium]|jgi:hypothetical protein
MKNKLLLLILAVIVLSWNFVFTDKKVGLTDQAKVLQGLSSAISHKMAIANYWETNASLPNHEDWLKESPGVIVDISQTIVNKIQVGLDGPGVISVYYGAKPGLESPSEIDGKKINLIPKVEEDKLVWTCIGTFVANLLPRNCNSVPENQIESNQ